jgi:hypothetical protein
MNEGRALVIDDGDLMTGRILEHVLQRAGWQAELVPGDLGLDVLRDHPPALLAVRQRTVRRTMDAQPYIDAAREAAELADTPRPVIVVFANFAGSTMEPGDFAEDADLVIDVPVDLSALERRFRTVRRRIASR